MGPPELRLYSPNVTAQHRTLVAALQAQEAVQVKAPAHPGGLTEHLRFMSL